MKLWTGDEWRPLSESEAAHRVECGYTVLEDDDPRTLVNETPAEAPPPAPEPLPEPPHPKSHKGKR